MIDLIAAARAAEQAALAAGAHLQASRSRLTEALLTQRDPEAVVAQIEHEAEALMREVLARAFPTHGVLGRTGGAAPHEGRPLWVLDPLDGRSAYRRGQAQYAVTTALVADGAPLVGVVYDPSNREFYGALRGHGAVLNGQPIACADDGGAHGGSRRAATVFPASASPRMPRFMAELARVLRSFGSVQRSASRSLQMAHLAAGRIDAFWDDELRPWSTAAGGLLLQEAGAVIEPRDGEPLLLAGAVVACVPSLHAGFVGVLDAA